VTDALEGSVRIFTRELLGVGASLRGCAVEITGNGDRRHSDDGSWAELPFQIVVLRLAGRQAEPP
jgi:hypothetical protein